MNILFNRFPNGKTKTLAMSYDDGFREDIRLVKIFNDYGIKGTFHINSGLFGDDRSSYRLSADEIMEVYGGGDTRWQCMDIRISPYLSFPMKA